MRLCEQDIASNRDAKKKRCAYAQTRRTKKTISINIVIFINFTYSKISLKYRLRS